MTGTNNVNSTYFGSESLKEAADDYIGDLLNYLKPVHQTTPIHVINILPLLQSKSLLGTSENIYLGGVVTLLYMAYTADGTKGHSCSSLLYAPQRQQ
jgi:hypothetical protein